MPSSSSCVVYRFCPVQFYDARTQRDHEESIHLSRTPVGNVMASSVVFCSQCSLGFPHIYALADHMHHSHGYNARARAALHDGPAGAPAAGADISGGGRGRDIVRPTAVRADSVDVSHRPLSGTTPAAGSTTSGGCSYFGKDNPLLSGPFHDRGPGTATVTVSGGSNYMTSSPGCHPSVPLSGTTTTATSATCGECSMTFDSDDDLESHVASAHYLCLATEYGCTSCLKLFARPEDLQKHLIDIHAHQLYRCTLCKQVFDSKVFFVPSCAQFHVLASTEQP